MSMPDKHKDGTRLSEAERNIWAWAMNCPIPKGPVRVPSSESDIGGSAIALENCTAHSCPFVKHADGTTRATTIYMHGEIVHMVIDHLKSLGVNL